MHLIRRAEALLSSDAKRRKLEIMTLLITEIHCLNGLRDCYIVFGADRRISINGKFEVCRKKIFEIPYLNAGIGYFGLAEVRDGNKKLSMSDWLSRFIRKSSNESNLESFANKLSNELNKAIQNELITKYISGFHVAGYNKSSLPEFWYVRNVEDDRSTLFGRYEVREEFLKSHAYSLGYNGNDPNSIPPGRVQIYRNGDIRAHVSAWEKIDESFSGLLNQSEFRRLRTISDYEEWVKFKMEIISYFYKKYCRRSIIGKPIDTLSLRN